MLATVDAGRAAITPAEIPDSVKAASLGAKTVKTLFLSDNAGSKPALVTAAFKIEKLGLEFTISPIVLPDGTGGTIGTASGTFLLQEDTVNSNIAAYTHFMLRICFIKDFFSFNG